jgi:hypothetical protein
MGFVAYWMVKNVYCFLSFILEVVSSGQGVFYIRLFGKEDFFVFLLAISFWFLHWFIKPSQGLPANPRTSFQQTPSLFPTLCTVEQQLPSA